MSKIKLLIFMSLVVALAAHAPVVALAQLPPYADPGGVPHYFGPYGNWAFSPLPRGPVASVTLLDGGTGYNNPLVTISDAYGTGSGAGGVTASVGAGGAVVLDLTAFVGGTDYSAPVVIIEDNPALCGGASQPTCGTGAIADAVIGGTLTGGMRKFVDKLPGVGKDPVTGLPNTNNLGQYIPVATPVSWPLGCTAGVDCTADYYEIALVEYTEQMHSDLPGPYNPSTPGAKGTRMRGYVQIYPLTNPYNPPVSAYPLTYLDGSPIYFPGTTTQVHAYDKPHYLGPIIIAKGRAHGVASPAGDPKPVRFKFYNLLPKGSVGADGTRPGDLFIPVDETVMGAGYGPALPGTAGEKFTQNRAAVHLHGNNTVWISDGNVHQWITPAGETDAAGSTPTPYPKGHSVRNVPDMGTECDAPGSGCMTFYYTNAQSARLMFYHDHALAITRLNVYVGEAGGYLLKDAVEDDMINGTNISGVNIPNPAVPTPNPNNPGDYLKVLPPDNLGLGIPLVIQDKTFVDASTIWAQDPTWNWGTGPRVGGKITAANTGDLWYPHVYMTVQNPWDLTGTNAVGRWHYGPWFNPPTPTCVNGLPVGCIEVGPVPNEYFGTAPWEPPMRPGVPNPSIPGESFLDTAMVNGTAYPYLEVEPKAYRFRVLNAANDRMFNLQLYVAADKNTSTTPDTYDPAVPRTNLCNTDPVSGGVPYDRCTEVNMVPVSVAPANQYADTPSGIPDPTTAGPHWIQIGTEGGFKPKPIVVPQQPIGYNLDPAYFSFGLVNQHSLFLGSAERADVIVDFTGQSGKTFILYNDSPAPVPAGAAPYDFYTGNGNQMDGGGAPNTQPGYGPNTRTIMQIRVGPAIPNPTPDVTLANLQAVFAKTAGKRGVFEVSQDPIIIPQDAFSSAYNNALPTTSTEQYVQIADMAKTFKPINYNTGTGNWDILPPITLPLEMKAMHDEMGGVYDTQFGRMSGMLGLSNPLSPVHVLIPYGLASPPTDLVKGSFESTPIGILPDGTQIWRIFHNGVDTHPIHVHLFTAQLINRVDQSGQVTGGTLPVDPTDLGWKETFKVNPLEVTYLALRPTVPLPAHLPFEVPDSWRLIDPTLPEGATLIPPPPAGWFDPQGIAIPEILNHYVNFGWEYVWHCHILSHEEMDMMHTIVYAVPPRAPTLQPLTLGGTTNNPRVTLNWIDNSIKEAQFTVQRASDANFTTGLSTFTVPLAAGSGTTVTFTDTTVSRDNKYWYKVFANGAPVGDLLTPGFPTMAADSVSNTENIQIGTAPAAPAAPTNLTATPQAGPQVSLTWRDNATNETGFVVERCTVVAPAITCANFAQIAAPGPRNNTGNVTYVDTTVAFGNSYLYQVAAVNSASTVPYTYATLANAVVVDPIPPAPTKDQFKVAVVKAGGNNYTANLGWASIVNPASFTIQRATNLSFTTNLTTLTAAGTARTLTDTVRRNTTYYYRIRANNSIGGFSEWTNALPFPIRTGP